MVLSLALVLAAFVCVQAASATCHLDPLGSSTCDALSQVPLYLQVPSLSFSSQWQVLGPFRSGTRGWYCYYSEPLVSDNSSGWESVWGADPLERQGGFRNLSYDPEMVFTSSLAANGSVKWKLVRADASNFSFYQAKVVLKVSFPETDWGLLQSVYGWSALQYQSWARGFLNLNGRNSQTVAFFTKGLLDVWVNGKPYFGGDYYRYGRAPVILRLDPGRHVVDLRLVRDVRVMGAVEEPPIIDVVIEAEVRNESLYVDESSLLISETTQGKLGSPLASVNVQNGIPEWVEVVSIGSPDVPQHKLVMGRTLHLAPYQTRPLIFNISLGQPPISNFSVKILYRTSGKDGRLLKTRPFYAYMTERTWTQTQKVTHLHPGKIVSYAILRPPPLDPTCSTPNRQDSLPIIVCLHGAGLESDSVQARQMLDALYGTCAWMLFPSGVTSWSGDDWHAWGAADVKAAVAAITNWIDNVDWGGPGVSLRDWIVTGHSNGGQGTWFLSTHYPDNIIAAAPVSGYSSIENYVPYSFWQSSQPLLSSIIQKSRSSFKHEVLLDNLAGIRILQQHGSSDDNVPAYHSRLMHELLELSGWPSGYCEIPGSGHWFEGVMTTPSLLDFFRQNTVLPSPLEAPLEFTMTVPSSGYTGSKYGISVDQLQSPDLNGRVKVTRDIENRFWYLQTENIYRFHLSGNASRIGLPEALILDDVENKFEVDADICEATWYIRGTSTKRWSVSREANWRNIHQRYGRQRGTMDAFMNSDGAFIVNLCSLGVEHIALQISRNLLQYFAADSRLTREYDPAKPTYLFHGEHGLGTGNVVTLAIGNDLPSSSGANFPIHSERNRFVLSQWPMYDSFDSATEATVRSDRRPCNHTYDNESGLGAIFLRPLQDERLELIVWGADMPGFEQAARLVPTLTGVGQPDFVVLSSDCRWKGHSGLYAAGFFDKFWQISPGSYISKDAKCEGISHE